MDDLDGALQEFRSVALRRIAEKRGWHLDQQRATVLLQDASIDYALKTVEQEASGWLIRAQSWFWTSVVGKRQAEVRR